ncbi:MAG: hypothetical protein AAF236_16020, partial [Verrucomicrobiota bacterium]
MKTNRRTFLRGLGAGIALPTFETFLPSKVTAANAANLALTESGMPLRTAFLYKPNGVNVAKWVVDGVGKNYRFNETHQ